MEALSEILNKQNLTSSQPNVNEYEKDGLIYCSKCNTPKQTIINFMGKPKKVRCSCKCEAEEFERLQVEQIAREKQIQIESLKINSLLGKRYANASFETSDISSDNFKRALDRCKKYCEVADEVLANGYGIYIYGNSGTGKTHLTACMCNELISQLRQCLFTNFFEISKSIRATFNSRSDTEERLIERISNVDFLFIDDIGTERLQNNGEDTWLQEKIYDIINKRYNAKKPTIFTSNYNLNELVAERGMLEKTAERVLEMSNAIIKLDGLSYRRRIKKDIPF